MSSSITPLHSTRPSSARLIVLDGFVPVPRGAIAAAPVMQSWPVKDPSDTLDYAVDFSVAIAGDQGDSITNVGISTTPNASGDLLLLSATMDGAVATMWFSAGNSGTIYTVTLSVTFASGRLLARSFALPVQSLSGPAPSSVFLITDAGQDLTDEAGNPIVTGS